MNDNFKVVLVHPDKQHSFETAKALTKSGLLEKYITSVYDKPGSFTHFLIKLCGGSFKKKLQAHRSCDIEDSQIKQYTELLSLLLLVLVRIDKSKKLYSKVKIYRDKRFNKKVAQYCMKNNINAVVSFDVVSAQLYKYLGEYKIIKILDMSAPNYIYMHSLFKKESEKYPSSSLKNTLNMPLVDYWKSQSEYEIKFADAFLVASDFTKQSLIEFGVEMSKIFKCVYGLNHNFFNTNERNENDFESLKCVYVGNVTEQKGFRYLVEVIKESKTNGLNTEFTIVGAYDSSNGLVCEANEYCKFTGHVLSARLKEILLQSDVFIFPSLADGFGFSVLESMACGVVPICSANAGVSDIIEDGVNGFVVNAADSSEIYKKLRILYNDRDLLRNLSSNASATASKMTWESYYVSVCEAVKSSIEKGGF